jgi:hypothetical protein
MSEDRYTYPTDGGEDPRDIDREKADGELVAPRVERPHPAHDQEVVRDQGLSSDAPGTDPSVRQHDEGQATDDAGDSG